MKKRTRSACLLAGFVLVLCGCDAGAGGSAERGPGSPDGTEDKVAQVIAELDRICREQTVYMVGPEKGARLAELVRSREPAVVVECGTALGYSGLWIARELEKLGKGRLITIELDADRARQARENFERAGLAARVEVRTGDAREIVREIEAEVDFLFLDCNYANYHPCFTGLEGRLRDGALVVADNAGLGAAGMKDYLDLVRSRHKSETEWFDIDLPWGKRDAMELTVFGKK
ncbi:MAG: class I SAM-dependent methyltransferase [Planctomycetota bacterium]